MMVVNEVIFEQFENVDIEYVLCVVVQDVCSKEFQLGYIVFDIECDYL